MRRSLTPSPSHRRFSKPCQFRSTNVCNPAGATTVPADAAPRQPVIFLDQKYHHFGQPASVDVGAGLGRILSPKPLVFHWFFDGFVGRACHRAIFGPEITWPGPRRTVRRGGMGRCWGTRFPDRKSPHPAPWPQTASTSTNAPEPHHPRPPRLVNFQLRLRLRGDCASLRLPCMSVVRDCASLRRPCVCGVTELPGRIGNE